MQDITRGREEEFSVTLGEGSGYIGAPFAFFLANALLILSSVMSLTVLYPLAYYFTEKRKTEDTYVDGKKLCFTGRLYQAYSIYFTGLLSAAASVALVNVIIAALKLNLPSSLLGYALSAAAAGINFLFVTSRMLRWRKKHIHYDGGLPGDSYLGKNLVKCAFVSLATSALGILTLGISYPLMYKLKQSYYTDMSVIDGDDVVLTGKVSSLYGAWFSGLFFCVITLGLFIPMLNYRLYSWNAENTNVREK